jgi:hypothetical protein
MSNLLFTARAELSGKSLGEADNLQSLLKALCRRRVNDYHTIVVQWDRDNLGADNCPELVARARLFEISPELTDLSAFIEY